METIEHKDIMGFLNHYDVIVKLYFCYESNDKLVNPLDTIYSLNRIEKIPDKTAYSIDLYGSHLKSLFDDAITGLVEAKIAYSNNEHAFRNLSSIYKSKTETHLAKYTAYIEDKVVPLNYIFKIQKGNILYENSCFTYPDYTDITDFSELEVLDQNIMNTLNRVVKIEQNYLHRFLDELNYLMSSIPIENIDDITEDVSLGADNTQLSDDILRLIYEDFNQHFEYTGFDEFKADVESLRVLKWKEGEKTYMASLFYHVMKAMKIKPLKETLTALTGGITTKHQKYLNHENQRASITAFLSKLPSSDPI